MPVVVHYSNYRSLETCFVIIEHLTFDSSVESENNNLETGGNLLFNYWLHEVGTPVDNQNRFEQ